MRVNPKVYQLAEGYEPVDRQEFDGRIVEVFYLNDFELIYEQNAQRGKLVVWSSSNGTDYRLFIEKGLYEEVKELYQAPINKIWLDFWDKCDDTTRKYNFVILLPLAVVLIVLYFVFSMFDATWSLYAQLACFAGFIIAMFGVTKFTKNKMNQFNQESVNLIKEALTPEGFDEIIAKQREYMDVYYENKQREIDEEIARQEAEEQANVPYVDEEATNVEEISEEIKESTEEVSDEN